MLLKAQLKLDSLANQAWIAVTAPFSKAQPESSLGNWLADDCRRFCNDNVRRTDICILSYSLIGTNYIAPGFITLKDVYNIFNFNNTVLLYELDGKTLNDLCDSIAKNGGTPVSGIQFKIDNQSATDIKINGQSLNPHLVYTIATDDYLPKSKKYALIFKDAKALDTKYRIRDIIIKSCEIRQQLKQSLIPILDKRIEYAE